MTDAMPGLQALPRNLAFFWGWKFRIGGTTKPSCTAEGGGSRGGLGPAPCSQGQGCSKQSPGWLHNTSVAGRQLAMAGAFPVHGGKPNRRLKAGLETCLDGRTMLGEVLAAACYLSSKILISKVCYSCPLARVFGKKPIGRAVGHMDCLAETAAGLCKSVLTWRTAFSPWVLRCSQLQLSAWCCTPAHHPTMEWAWGESMQ